MSYVNIEERRKVWKGQLAEPLAYPKSRVLITYRETAARSLEAVERICGLLKEATAELRAVSERAREISEALRASPTDSEANAHLARNTGPDQ